MNGAELRIKRERALVWELAFLPLQKTPPSFDQYVNGGKRRTESPAMLDMRLRASVRGLRGISMADALKSMRK